MLFLKPLDTHLYQKNCTVFLDDLQLQAYLPLKQRKTSTKLQNTKTDSCPLCPFSNFAEQEMNPHTYMYIFSDAPNTVKVSYVTRRWRWHQQNTKQLKSQRAPTPLCTKQTSTQACQQRFNVVANATILVRVVRTVYTLERFLILSTGPLPKKERLAQNTCVLFTVSILSHNVHSWYLYLEHFGEHGLKMALYS